MSHIDFTCSICKKPNPKCREGCVDQYLEVVDMDNLGDGESLVIYLSDGSAALMGPELVKQLRQQD